MSTATADPPALVEPFTDEDVRAFATELAESPAPICEARGRDERTRCSNPATWYATLDPCGCGWLSCEPCRLETLNGLTTAIDRGILLACSRHRIQVRMVLFVAL